jgi:hypothetical protein
MPSSGIVGVRGSKAAWLPARLKGTSILPENRRPIQFNLTAVILDDFKILV